MLSRVKSLESRLLTRRCVACGFDGEFADDAAMCPACGVDLILRPPRSYAEMELLLGQPVVLDAPLHRRPNTEHLLRRWAIVGAIMLGGLMAIIYLILLALTV
jgi:hypothetical protein